MTSKLWTWWQKIRNPSIVVAIIALVIALVIGVLTLSIVVLLSNGVGINGYTKTTVTREVTATPLKTPIATVTPSKVTIAEEQQPGKTLWDLLQLLIVPIILAIGGFWLNQLQKSREERTTKDNQNETALQGYFDKMSELLLEEEKNCASPNQEMRYGR